MHETENLRKALAGTWMWLCDADEKYRGSVLLDTPLWNVLCPFLTRLNVSIPNVEKKFMCLMYMSIIGLQRAGAF